MTLEELQIWKSNPPNPYIFRPNCFLDDLEGKKFVRVFAQWSMKEISHLSTEMHIMRSLRPKRKIRRWLAAKPQLSECKIRELKPIFLKSNIKNKS